jgi:hypothetical protein
VGSIFQGTDAAETYDARGYGPYVIDMGGGNDTLTIDMSSGRSPSVADMGGGNDVISIRADLNTRFTVHGGTGDDRFTLRSGGVVYGDAGSDVFTIEDFRIAWGWTATPIIADFSLADRLDITHFLSARTSWKDGAAIGTYARLIQANGDTLVEVNTSDLGWQGVALLKDTNATSLSAEQLGFAPTIASVPKASISATGLREGMNGRFTVTLAEASDMPTHLTGVIEDAAMWRWDWSADIAAGQTSAQVDFHVGEGAAAGSMVTVRLSPETAIQADGLNQTSLSIMDNDAAGFSVGWLGAKTIYTIFTRANYILDPILESIIGDFPGPHWWVSERAAVNNVANYAKGTTSVALTAYQFFTGKTPTLEGVDYLVKDGGPNPNNLNSDYYRQFNTVNRAINFAVNLGKNGEAKDSFAAKYGAMSLFDATREAYKTIFGTTPTDDKLHTLLDTRVDYLAYYGGDGATGIGTKAAMVGFLLAASISEKTGLYARALETFYLDFADGSAQFHVDMIGVYGPGTFLDAFGS